MERTRVVLRIPLLKAGFRRIKNDRRVVDDGLRGEALFNRGRVDKRLKGGAGLTPGLCNMVELVQREVIAADERLNGAGIVFRRDESGFSLRNLRDFP